MNSRQQVINYLKVLLGTIPGVKNVYEWNEEDLAPAQHPVIAIKDPIDTINREGVYGQEDHTLTTVLLVYIHGRKPAEEAREMVDLIGQKLAEDSTFGGLIYDVAINTASLEVDPATRTSARIEIETEISYYTEILRF